MERIMLNICIVLNDTHYCVKQHLQNLLMLKTLNTDRELPLDHT